MAPWTFATWGRRPLRGWGDDSILLGPFFSDPNLYSVLLGSWRKNDAAIERGLEGVPVSKVEAIFAGHSHYDQHRGSPRRPRTRAPRSRLRQPRGSPCPRSLRRQPDDRLRGSPQPVGPAQGTRRRRPAHPLLCRPLRARAADRSLSLGQRTGERGHGLYQALDLSPLPRPEGGQHLRAGDRSSGERQQDRAISVSITRTPRTRS